MNLRPKQKSKTVNAENQVKSKTQPLKKDIIILRNIKKQREMPKLNVETKIQNLNVKITISSKAKKQSRIKAEDVL